MHDSLRGPASIPCNPEVLKYLREQLGWTQEELAAKAGYSDRLIRKAEAGGTLKPLTIEHLAAALSTHDRPVHVEDLTTNPVALAKCYTEALYVHQAQVVSAIRHFLDDDVVFLMAGDPQVLPFAGEHRGIEAVDRGFRLFFSLVEAPSNHDFRQHYHYIAQGADVVVWGESYLHPIGQPLEKPMRVSNLLRFRRGKLYYFEDNYDTHWAASVLA